MPQADPAERLVDRREPGDDPAAALELRLQLGERDLRGRLDQPSEIGLIRCEQRPALAAVAGRRGAARRAHPLHDLIAADGLTANRRAAPRIELPCSTARTIRQRRSNDIGAGMTHIPPVSTDIVESRV